jgi:hypothetical protein
LGFKVLREAAEANLSPPPLHNGEFYMKYPIRVLRAIVLALLFIFPGLVLNTQASAIYDYDGDGRSDFIVKRFNGPNTQHTWFILRSRDGFLAQQWGYQSDVGGAFFDGEAPGDFDGDGKWDIAVIRQTIGSPPLFWFVLNSHDGSMTAQHWGISGDQLVPQDYDGDGKTDFAVYRAGWWYILRSSDNRFYAEKFGASEAPLMGGDYDGDGKDDLAVLQDGGLWIRYSATGWWIRYAIGNSQITGVVSGDYDGDGKADVAIVQGNLWLWGRSSDGQLGGGWRFGRGLLDTPVPADYDGDGKTDIAVFRDGAPDYFYVLQSRDGFLAMPWGGGSDGSLSDRRYIRPVGFRPSGLNEQPFKDKGPFPRLVEIRKN